MYKDQLQQAHKIITLFLLLFLLISPTSYAQTKLTGRIFEYKTRTGLEGIKIENLRTHAIATSDTGGRFSISAIKGDRISCSDIAYKTDTVYLPNLRPKEIFLVLKQEHLLKEITIVNKEMNLGTLMPTPVVTPFGGNTVRYQTDANGNNKGGLKLAIPGSNSEEKKRVRDAQLGADEETKKQITKIFSAQNLQNYLPIKGQELENFSILYTPPVKVYRNKFNATAYIDSCYKLFVKIPVAKRQSKEFLDLNAKQ